jgi:hypothetical protein
MALTRTRLLSLASLPHFDADCSSYTLLCRGSVSTPALRAHLSSVYQVLFLIFTAAVTGVLVQSRIQFFNITLSHFLSAGLLLALAITRPQGGATSISGGQRLLLLSAYGFFQGVGLTPLIQLAAAVSPSLILSALLATSVIFLVFSVAALLSPRREFLYLGGILGSLVSVMFVLSLGARFGLLPSHLVFNITLYGGLAIFMLYIVVDTQLIMEKFAHGDRDAAWHAAMLAVDFVAIFVRVLIILMQNAEKNKRRTHEERKQTRR